MSVQAKRYGRPPDVDEGDVRDLAAHLGRELRPTPGRLGDSVRIVVVVLSTVAIAETFRIPDIATSAYLVLFLAHREAVSTILTALISGITVVLAILATIAVFMLSLSEPALRIPLMAITTFGAMFLSRATTLGPLFFAAGFIVAYGLTMGDEVLGLALQPATSGNAPQLELPEIVFISPEEALVRALLWLSLAVAVPVALLIAANLLAGRDPARILRRRLADRLATAARFCGGERGAESELEAQGFEGTSELRKVHHLAGLLHRGRRRSVWGASLIDDIGRLGLLLLAWLRVEGQVRFPLVPAAAVCLAAERALRTGEAPRTEPANITVAGAARPLAGWISHTLRSISETVASSPGTAPPKGGDALPRRLLATDAFRNPEYVRFALKVTLAVMFCYLVMRLADWPGIGTCVVTCFFVALGTTGETVHKATLRIVGCLIGAALGLGAILFVTPHMTNLGELLLLLAPVTLFAAWVGCGTERIAYAGWQIGLAFYLVVLHGFAPTIDLYTARDRTIGILLGNIVIFVIFTTVWPVSVADVARTNVARALEQLAALLGLGGQTDRKEFQIARTKADQEFGKAIAHARAVLVNAPFEGSGLRRAAARRPIDASAVDQIGRLFIPISVIVDLCADRANHDDLPQATREAISAHHQALEGWFERAASWVRSGERANEVIAGLPQPPVLSGGREHVAALATWYGLLHEDISDILSEVGPQPEAAINHGVDHGGS
jgi:multidrug resistance protein MdtO